MFVCLLINQSFQTFLGGSMKSRIFSRNTVLAIVGAVVLVVLYTSGAFAQGTESIKALFVKDTAVTSAPVDPGTPESR